MGINLTDVQFVAVKGVVEIHSDFAMLNRENGILSVISEIKGSTGNEDMKNARKVLGLKTGPSGAQTTRRLHEVIESIPQNEIAFLFNKAHEIADNDINMIDFVTALRVYFYCGEMDSKVTLIYEPIAMKRMKFDTVTNDTIYELPASSIAFFQFNGTKFIPSTVNPLDTNANFYQKRILVKRKIDDANYANFDINPMNADPTSIVISFRSIAALFQKNDEHELVFFNSVDQRQGLFRHSLLLGTSSIDDEESDLFYSDRSHLCPPCNHIGYDLA